MVPMLLMLLMVTHGADNIDGEQLVPMLLMLLIVPYGADAIDAFDGDPWCGYY